jgi:hypothetical protein
MSTLDNKKTVKLLPILLALLTITAPASAVASGTAETEKIALDLFQTSLYPAHQLR